jgi:hypothetical protein
MKVKVVKSEPADKGQCSIENLIGKQFKVIGKPDEEDGSVSVRSYEFGGIIKLNKIEYEEVFGGIIKLNKTEYE